MTKQRRDQLREIASKSTKVVAWYDDGGTVRGPFNRWFHCTDVPEQYRSHVAWAGDDCTFAAAAMNNLVPLLDELDAMDKEIADLRMELLLMGRDEDALK